MIIKADINIEFNKENLCNAISNALFSEYTNKKNQKKVKEMTLRELCEYIPNIIADEIIEDMQDIIIVK